MIEENNNEKVKLNCKCNNLTITSIPEFSKKRDENIWIATDGTRKYELTTVYHLLNPAVAKDNDYKKQIIF